MPDDPGPMGEDLCVTTPSAALVFPGNYRIEICPDEAGDKCKQVTHFTTRADADTEAPALPEVQELEQAGCDAVIVSTRDIAALAGELPPDV